MNSNGLERRSEETDEFYLERLDYESKRDHGGNASYQFIFISLVLFLLTRTKILTLSVVGYFFGGIFLAAILSIPTWFLKLALARRITMSQAQSLRFYWRIVEWAYNLAVTWSLFRLYKSFVT